MEGGRPVTLTHRGGAWCPPLSCPSQWYSSLSLLWSVLALSWVLAWRVGVLWHSHIGGEPGVPPCLVQVNGTPIFHCYGPNWLLAGYWHGGWASCDTHTPGGRLVSPPCLVQVNGTPVFHCHGPYWLIAGYWHGGWASCDTHTSGGSLVSPAVLSKSMVLQSFTVMVRIGFKLGIGMEGGRPVTLTHRGGAWCPPLSCPSQWFSSLSLSWSVLAYSWVLAWRVGFLWHSHIGGEPGVPRCLVQVNGTPVFHCYGPYWL